MLDRDDLLDQIEILFYSPRNTTFEKTYEQISTYEETSEQKLSQGGTQQLPAARRRRAPETEVRVLGATNSRAAYTAGAAAKPKVGGHQKFAKPEFQLSL